MSPAVCFTFRLNSLDVFLAAVSREALDAAPVWELAWARLALAPDWREEWVQSAASRLPASERAFQPVLCEWLAWVRSDVFQSRVLEQVLPASPPALAEERVSVGEQIAEPAQQGAFQLPV